MMILRIYAKPWIQALLRALGFFQGFGEGGHDFEDVADNAIASDSACGIFSGALMPRPIATINGACVKSTADFASLKRSSGLVRICSALTVTFTAFTGAFPEGCAASKSARNAPDWNDANHGAIPTKITSAAVLPWNICRTKTSLPPSLR